MLSVCCTFFNITCHSVFSPPEFCHGSGSTMLPMGRGYLSSQVTDDTSCGSIDHPWVIELSQGQQITFSIMDFTGSEGHVHNTEGPGCPIYGYISEPTLAKNSSICGGLSRERELYTSSSSRVQVQIPNLEIRGSGAQFLLKYEGEAIQKSRVHP